MPATSKPKGIFIFRRDFRIHDNGALNTLSKKVSMIIPVFIFDPFQIKLSKHNKNYFSEKAVQFMIESLDDLSDQISKKGGRLRYYYDKPHIAIKKLLNKEKDVEIVAYNSDFSPYSRKRDSLINEVCVKANIQVLTDEDDLLLHHRDAIMSKSNNKLPLKVFGSYFKRAKEIKPAKPSTSRSIKFTRGSKAAIEFKKDPHSFYEGTSLIKHDGGRDNALKLLHKSTLKKFSEYHELRDLLDYETTRLSAHLKFGNISIREAYYAIKQSLGSSLSGKALIRQLYWRNFYFVLSAYRNSDFGHIEERFKRLRWTSGKKEERLGKALWDDALTGYPVIDACVRQLNDRGWMHNRGRLLVANFSTKILKLDPFGEGKRKWSGQESFSRQLLDGCYANNYGNWMWILGPYDSGGYRYGRKGTFGGRIFKDVINFKAYDKELVFIRKYIPELKDVPDKDVFKWHLPKIYSKYPDIDYPKPIVDFEEEVNAWYKLTK